jgi:DNA-binding transcriptional regulator YiaG
MSEIVTIYRICRYAASEPELEGESCSLLPWREESGGTDDGGRDYVLPEGYGQRETEEGEPAVFSPAGVRCSLMLHNGSPLLIDEEARRAHLLEPVKKIASFRQAAGLTRAELAQRLGVTQAQLYEWENLEQEPTPSTLRRIAEILRCEPEDFR